MLSVVLNHEIRLILSFASFFLTDFAPVLARSFGVPDRDLAGAFVNFRDTIVVGIDAWRLARAFEGMDGPSISGEESASLAVL